jgi:hypothetical protein
MAGEIIIGAISALGALGAGIYGRLRIRREAPKNAITVDIKPVTRPDESPAVFAALNEIAKQSSSGSRSRL